MNQLDTFWNTLAPGPARTELLTGSVSAEHLGHLAALCQGQDALQASLALAAWEADPLDGQRAAVAQSLAADSSFPEWIGWITDKWRVPKSLAYFQRIAAQADSMRLQRFLAGELAKDTHLFWLWQSLQATVHFGLLSFMREQLEVASSLPAPLKAMLLGDCSLMCGDIPQAEASYAKALEHLGGQPWPPDRLWPMERLGLCRFLSGDAEQALEHWRKVLAQRPWHTSLLSQCAAILDKRHLPLPKGQWPGSACVLLYSFNHGPALDQTLEALSKSDAPFVLALNNGSSDSTSQVLKGWQDRLGTERMAVISLAANVGAPGARNLLMCDERVTRRDFALFLDDDALVPPDLVGLLMRAVRHQATAHVWGCRVVDRDDPWRIQSADLHLRPSPGGDGSFAPFDPEKVMQQPFSLSSLHQRTPDFGGFNHVRSCVSVTGCCHMFRVSEFQEHGGFDLRFSPTQFDDLERDLRLAVKGRLACCQGFLRVKHLKNTGKQNSISSAQKHSGLANRYILYSLFTPDELATIREMELAQLEQELQNDLDLLRDMFGERSPQ